MQWGESGDYISDLCVVEDAKLLSSSGDGHLQVFDVRRDGKWYAQSEGIDDDLLSVLVVDKKKGKGGAEHRRKVLVGTKESGVQIFSWDLLRSARRPLRILGGCGCAGGCGVWQPMQCAGGGVQRRWGGTVYAVAA